MSASQDHQSGQGSRETSQRGTLLEDLLASISSNLAQAGLNLDPEMRGRLQQIDGRCIAVNCSMPPLALFLNIGNGTLMVRSSFSGKPHVAVTGTGFELASWLAAPHRIDGIQIEGDETVLLEVTAALRTFDPDLVAPFTRLFGPGVTQNMLGGAELAVSAIRSAAEGVGHAIEKTAAAQFVTREDTGALLDVLDDLRLRIDRLAARIRAKEEPQE